MAEKEIIKNRKIHFIALAIGCWLCMHLGDHATAFMMAFVPNALVGNFFFHRFLPSTIGFGLVGALLGYTLWSVFSDHIRDALKFTPIIMLIVENIQVYVNFLDSSGHYSPFGLLGYLLTSLLGYQLLVVVPASVIASFWFFYRKSNITAKGGSSFSLGGND